MRAERARFVLASLGVLAVIAVGIGVYELLKALCLVGGP
jgi:hypothetical protein